MLQREQALLSAGWCFHLWKVALQEVVPMLQWRDDTDTYRGLTCCGCTACDAMGPPEFLSGGDMVVI
jgi:hypothetical protein